MTVISRRMLYVKLGASLKIYKGHWLLGFLGLRLLFGCLCFLITPIECDAYCLLYCPAQHMESCVINQALSEFLGLDKGMFSLSCDKYTFRSWLLGSKLMATERKACSEVKTVVVDPWCACSDKWWMQHLTVSDSPCPRCLLSLTNTET